MLKSEACPHCKRQQCYEHCYEAKNGKHSPDTDSIRPADGATHIGQMLFDIWCKRCGQSGSFSVELRKLRKDIQWS